MPCKRRKKRSSKLGVLLLATLILVACGQAPEGMQSAGTSAPPVASTRENAPAVNKGSEDSTAKETVLRAYLPMEKAELGEILQGLALKDDVDLQVEMPARGAQYLEALKGVMAAGNPPDLFLMQDLNEVAAMEAEAFSPLYRQGGGGLVQALAGMSPEGGAAMKADTLVGLPLGYYAQGYLADLELLAALLGAKDKMALQRDIAACSWEEWRALVTSLEAYLQKPGSIAVRLNGTRYTTPAARPAQARQLRGIFAVADGDTQALADHAMAATVGVAYTSLAEMDADEARDRQIVLQPALRALFGMLDLETMYMARTGSAAYRGERYEDGEALDGVQAEAQLLSGNALFLRGDSRMGAKILAENANKTDSLMIIPLKMPPPTEEEGGNSLQEIFGTEEEAEEDLLMAELNAAVAEILAGNNQRLWYASDGYLCIGAGAGNTAAAEQLLLRLYLTEEGRQEIWQNLQLQPYTEVYPEGLLRNQIQQLVTNGEGNLLPGREAALSQQAAVLGSWLQQELLPKGEWGTEEAFDFVNRGLAAFGLPEVARAEE